ncbi:protein of unknown function [Candidatus Hydrogenisulfobacillus filiaventi]|uniref:SAF domain-containing protein n=1 Tax=Candidatus Hydrogenisulfobacillus filiaventi TaxID=2707344 RepID=A0A6F8ZHP0_9FIRM|nr:protein of unknown function [Candidatus Hydrogenisulfobacillus filiaventi]
MAVRLPAGMEQAWRRWLGRDGPPRAGGRSRRVWGVAWLAGAAVSLAASAWQDRQRQLVPVAAVPLPAGVRISPAAVRWVPVDWVRLGPPGLRNPAQPAGPLYTTRFLPAGSLLAAGAVSRRPPGGSAGTVWVPLPALPAALAGLVRPGARVRVLAGSGRQAWESPPLPVVAVAAGNSWTGGSGGGLVVAMPAPVWNAYRTVAGSGKEMVVMCAP